jgi:hypothetical protein
MRMGSKFEKPDYTDALFLARALLGLSSLSLLWGHSSISTILSFITRLFLQDSTKAASTKALEKWLLLSLVCAVVSLISWCCLSFSSSEHHDELYKLWFMGFVLQKVTGLGMGFFLFENIGFQETEVDNLTQFLQVRVTILEGRNLVPKDKNFWGKRVSSDPYVKVFHGPNKMGKTYIVKKTLDPKWDNGKETFVRNVVPRALDVYKTIECIIFDHDQLSTDDSMGTCFVKIPNTLNARLTSWYPVEKGDGKNYCRNAKGELKVEIELRSEMGSSFRPNCRSTASEDYVELSPIVEKQI